MTRSSTDPTLPLLLRFQQEAQQAGAIVHGVMDSSQIRIYVRDLAQDHKIREIFASPSPLIHKMGLLAFLAQEGLEPQGERLKGESLAQGLGLGEVPLAIAESGTLLQVTPHIEGRLISMLCPIYVVLLSSHSLVATLEEALTWLEKKGPELSPYVSLLTGPSRSADIEGVLTLGVHGPRELHILFVD